MNNDNGGYNIDRKAIEQSLDQNQIDHKMIMDRIDQDHLLLQQIKDVYIRDIIIIKTKINIFSYILGIFSIQTVGMAYKFIVNWFEKR